MNGANNKESFLLDFKALQLIHRLESLSHCKKHESAYDVKENSFFYYFLLVMLQDLMEIWNLKWQMLGLGKLKTLEVDVVAILP